MRRRGRRHRPDGRLGRACRASARGDEVVGWDPEPEALAAAVARGALTAAASLEEAVADAELVVVAAPIAQLPSVGRGGARSDAATRP